MSVAVSSSSVRYSTKVDKHHRDDVSEFEESDVLLIDNDIEFPDGGWHAWTVVLGAMLGLVPAYGLINSLGAIQAYIANNQLSNVATSTVSWIFSIFSSLSFASCIFAGAYFDRNGARFMLLLGSALILGGMFATANCTKVWHFVLAFGIGAGVGCGILMTVVISCVATWFKEKRGIANSVASLGGSIGGIAFPLVLRKLFSSVGFPWAIRILSFILAACLIGTCSLCRERVSPAAEPFKTRMEAVRYYTTNSFEVRYFRDWKFVTMTAACALAESTLITCATFFASYAIRRGNSETTAYTLVTIVSVGGVFGRVSGWIADKYIGNISVLIISLGFIAVINFTMWLPFGKYVGVLYVYAWLYGFTDSSILSLTPVTVGQISSVRDFGKYYSTMYFCVALVTLPVIPIGGAIIGNESIKGYNWFIVYSSILSLLSAVFYALTRYLCVGTRKVKF